MIKVSINGFGRIGRTFFRIAFGRPELEIVAINDLGDLDNLAYLLAFDTVYRHYDKKVEFKEEGGKKYLVVDSPAGDASRPYGAGKKILFLQEKDPAKLPWKELGVDVAIESTGFFEEFEAAAAHLRAGAKKVVISAPGKGEYPDGKTILLGINENDFQTCHISSNGSCTTNAVHPVIKVMSENPGIKKALLSTVHAVTATQRTVDGPDKKDWRRGRAAFQSIVPSTTGAAIAVTKAMPELKGKFDGIALRVPIITGSLADVTFVANRPTSVEEINDIFKKASLEPKWKGILAVSDEQLVSSDIIGEPHASIVDLKYTKVVDGDLVKILAWYDNEWGYSMMLTEHVIRAGNSIAK